jgi:hypothetical protein
MRSIWARVYLLAFVTILVVGISGVVFAANYDTVNVTITINIKYELEVTAGSVVSGVLDPHTITVLNSNSVGWDDSYETTLRVKTNSKSWVIQAQVTSDASTFLGVTDSDPAGSYTGKLEVSTNGVDGAWYDVKTDSATNITSEQVSAGANQMFTVNYRVTTTWLHEAGTSYPMIVTYTITSYTAG